MCLNKNGRLSHHGLARSDLINRNKTQQSENSSPPSAAYMRQ